MALAFAEARQNGPHRRVNKIARAVTAEALRTGGDVNRIAAKMVKQFEALKGKDSATKKKAAPALFGRGDGKKFGQAAKAGKLKAADPEARALRAQAKRVVAQMLHIPSSRLGGKAAAYYATGKVESYKLPQRKGIARSTMGGTGLRRAVPHKPKGVWASKWYSQLAKKHGQPDTKAGQKRAYQMEYASSPFAEYSAARAAFRKGSKHFDSRTRTWKSPIGPGVETFKRKGPKKTSAAVLDAAIRRDKRARKNVSALMNPVSALGESALMNPGQMFANVGSYVSEYALPVGVAGAVAGGVHALAAQKGLTSGIADQVAKVPVVGAWVADNAPYTTQGFIVGVLLGGVAGVASQSKGDLAQTAAKYLGITAGTAIAFGAGIDAFNWISGRAAASSSDEGSALVSEADAAADEDLGALGLGDLAFAPMGDLAFAPMGDLAFVGAQSNPFLGASLSAPVSGGRGGDALASAYGQSSFADAYYSGADFSVAEGEALLNGSQAWCNTFGNPSHRMAGKKASEASHHAGKEGHRWGWLIALVGTEKARRIAALPPARRLRVIQRLRRAAMSAYAQAMAEGAQSAGSRSGSQDAHTQLPAAGTVTNGAFGAMGPGMGYAEYLGDPVVFMGA